MSDWPESLEDLSAIERASLRAFVESCAEHLTGRVLDYGCGRQPYRDVVDAARGEYVPYNRAEFNGCAGSGNAGPNNPLALGADTILCTQVIQYIPEPLRLLDQFRDCLEPSAGRLILTGPTCWVEPPGHLHSHTLEGVRRLLEQAGFVVDRLESRGHVGPGFSIGYGAIGRA